MKRYMHQDEDWRTDTADNEVNALRELMASNIDKQDDAEVGIFWYDPENQELFGVKSADVDDVPYYRSTLFNGAQVKTCRPLHYKVWEREYYRGKDKRFRGDYTLVPRGRIFYVENKGFVVIVGDWIDDYPEAKDEIIFEFNLPHDVEFRKDIHWNLSHGWSDKFM